ncbi:MAG: hypothetical protein AUJ75_03070 [Candidatus Omnitrophica bacterium CG1_02_49_10]|nr:MAG: hypothetical protein AUJ75_03070 [Candidatus Omnitrophica bacterium CG1_02_49_10]
MYPYDIAVVGAGPAGIMAAIRASQLKRNTLLIERNASIGRKMLLTGKGRCNITNTASVDTFVEKFGKNGAFLRSALFAFSNTDLIDFFGSNGLALKIERQGRVFPSTDKASSVYGALNKSLEANKAELKFNTRIKDIKKEREGFLIYPEVGGPIRAGRVVLATGGSSYRETGSTGDGFEIADKLGHTIIPLRPELVPLRAKERWVKDLQGLSLKNIRIVVKWVKNKKESTIGEMIFTHFGVSGPLILDMSGEIVAHIAKHGDVPLLIDLKPGMSEEVIEKRLLREFGAKGNFILRSIMKELMPQRMVPVFLRLISLDGEMKISQVTQGARRSIAGLFKEFPLTITGSLPIEEAMVTGGGVSIKEIDPRTMESKIVPGLYFAGEVVDLSAPSGGYNLQEAFSTGYLAGTKASDG